MLPHPDLHIHHIHVGPKPGVRQRQDPEKCFLNSNKGGTFEGCYKPIRVMEQHGDYYCRDEDGGLDCFTESVPDG